MINEEEMKRAEYFFKNKVMVHALTIKGYFYNGYIIEYGNTFFVINDRILGKQYINYTELKKPLQEYMEDKK